MIRKAMSVGSGWLGATALTIAAALLGSSVAMASVTTPADAISFPKKERVKVERKQAFKKRYRKAGYAKRRAARKSVAGKSSSRRVSSRRSYKKRARIRRIAAKTYRRKVYRKKAVRRKGRRSIPRSRGHLMATLKSVKPKGLPLSLAAAVVTVESGWRVNARGSSGERGLMQLMPATARQLGARGNLYNPRTNMRYGTKYLHYCYRRARGNIAATIGCYNRGPGLMWSWNKSRITRRYVGRVRRYMRRS